MTTSTPMITEDVAKLVADIRGPYIVPRHIKEAADTIEAQAAEIARLNIGLQVERQATEYWRDFNARSQSQALQLEYDAERLEDERDDLKEDEASFKATIAKLRARAEAQALRITELERERNAASDNCNELAKIRNALVAENAVLREALIQLEGKASLGFRAIEIEHPLIALGFKVLSDYANAALSTPNERASRIMEARKLVAEVAKCGVEYHAGTYVTVQIDCETWNALTRLDTQGA